MAASACSRTDCAPSACSRMDAATVDASINKEDTVDVDALAVAGTEAEGVTRAPARRSDTFPIQYYCEKTVSLLDTRGRFADPPTLFRRFHKARRKVTPLANLPVRLNNN